MKFFKPKNTWLFSAKNIKITGDILEAELYHQGSWYYNKIQLHPILFNRNLINNNGILHYKLPKQIQFEVMDKLFKKYDGENIPFVPIKKIIMLSVSLPKYDKTRNETISILNQYNLPPISVYFGYTKQNEHTSKFYDFMYNKNQSNFYTLGMLEIFENFVNQSKENNEWFLYVEDDVRPININPSQDLTKLYNVPVDAELIRPYMGKNEACDITQLKYRISYGGGNNHAFYISTSGCKKVLNYAKKYKWKYICDIDIYKLAKYCGGYPTAYDQWNLIACNRNNDITEKLLEDEKINMYQLSHVIFDQTSNPLIGYYNDLL